MRIILALITVLLTAAAASAEEIRDFAAEIFIGRDSSIAVEEKIAYDFGRELKHGIFRTIPYKYKIGYENYHLRMRVSVVSDFEAAPYKYEVSRQGAEVFIKIGDADIQITGAHGYKIDYKVERAIVFFKDHDELYWNVTGNGWQVPMGRVSAKVYLEGGMPSSQIKAKCYTGYEGSADENCSYNITPNVIEFVADRQFLPNEGLTIVVLLPKGVLAEPSGIQKAVWFIADNWHFGLPALTLAALCLLWLGMGRDPESSGGVIPVQYEPPQGITPAEAGTLLDETANILDITSTIIDLAVRGYLTIEEIQSERVLYFFSNTDYRLTRHKSDAGGLKAHEREILSGLFSAKNQIMISELKNKFYTRLPGIEQMLYGEMIRGGYFPVNPDKIRGLFIGIGAVVAVLGFLIPFDIPIKIAICVSGGIISIFSRFMPKKTKKGSLLKAQLLGFREFIERAEHDRIERLAKDDPTLFGRVLPFALVFELEEKWAGAFADIYKTPPSWFSSSRYGNSFSSSAFASDIGRSLGAINRTLSSSPSKSRSGGSGSSGGRSGGGFGGGGGGSW
ncbi:MAG: DUF2207 domain-containing protein [Deltaproteobacteria bacterium]